MVPSPDFDFFGSFGDQGAPGAVTRGRYRPKTALVKWSFHVIGSNNRRGSPRKQFEHVLGRWRDPYLIENSLYQGRFRVCLASPGWTQPELPALPDP